MTDLVDDATAHAIRAMPVDGEHDLPDWLTVLRGAVEAGADFENHVRQSAGAFDATRVGEFLAVATADSARDLLARESDLPALLAALRDAERDYEQESQEPEQDADEFGWVTESQRAALTQAWGDGWRDSLTADLDQRWGENWQAHPADHKTAWLEDLVAAGTFADEFAWVTPTQQAALEGVWGSEWRDNLSGDLHQRWGAEWSAHPPDHKTAWLGDLIAAGAFTTPAPAATQPPEQAPAPEAALDKVTELASELPGFAELSEEDIAKVIAEVLEQQVGS